MRQKHWVECVRNKVAQNYYLGFCYTILRKNNINILPSSLIQDIVQGEENNKLDKVFMGFIALQSLSAHKSASSSKATRTLSLL